MFVLNLVWGCAMAKALSCWPLGRGKLGFLSCANPRGLYGGNSGSWTGFSPGTFDTLHTLSSLNKTVLSFSLGFGFLRQTGSHVPFAYESLRIRIDWCLDSPTSSLP